MRGIGITLSRLPAARAFIAGAAFLAGTMAQVAHAQPTGPGDGDETAMAVPLMVLPGASDGVALPRPLSPSDVVLVRRIFVAQARGNLAAVVATILLDDEAAQRGETGDDATPERVPVPALSGLAIALCTGVTVLFGVWPQPLIDFANHATLLFLPK